MSQKFDSTRAIRHRVNARLEAARFSLEMTLEAQRTATRYRGMVSALEDVMEIINQEMQNAREIAADEKDGETA